MIKDGVHICDFCDKTQYEVKKIIQGSKSSICDECVELCVEILRDQEVEKCVSCPISEASTSLH